MIDLDLWGVTEEKRKVCGIGYDSTYSDNISDLDSYKTWYRMLLLCKTHPENNAICDEWLDFSNFNTWYDENFYKVYTEKMDFVKVFYNKDNIIFSPEQCLFLPHKLSCALNIFRDNNKRSLPVGVGFNSKNGTYYAMCSINNSGRKSTKRKCGFITPLEAENFYKKMRIEDALKAVYSYKNRIPEDTFLKILERVKNEH